MNQQRIVSIVFTLCLSSLSFGQESEDDLIRLANAEIKMLRATVRRQHIEIAKLKDRVKYLEGRCGMQLTAKASTPVRPVSSRVDKPIDGAVLLRKLSIGAGLIDQDRRGKTEQNVRDGLQVLLAKTNKGIAGKKIVLKIKPKSVSTVDGNTVIVIDSFAVAGRYNSKGFSILFHDGNMIGKGGFVVSAIPMKIVIEGVYNIPDDKTIEITGVLDIKMSLLDWTPSHTTAEDYPNLIAFIGIPGKEYTDNRNIRVWKAYFAVCMNTITASVDGENIKAKAQPLGLGE
jgi:hypothetical protein